MSATHTNPVTHMSWQRALLFASGCVFSLTACAITSAAEILVVTDREHPVSAGYAVRVIELDAPGGLVESELAAHLPADPEKAAAIARRRLHDGGAVLQKRLALAYQGIVEAWGLGITKIPAVVVDRQYVVYGERDVGRAVSLIKRHRSAQP